MLDNSVARFVTLEIAIVSVPAFILATIVEVLIASSRPSILVTFIVLLPSFILDMIDEPEIASVSPCTLAALMLELPSLIVCTRLSADSLVSRPLILLSD